MLHQLTYLHSMAGLTLAEVPIFVQEMLEGGEGGNLMIIAAMKNIKILRFKDLFCSMLSIMLHLK